MKQINDQYEEEIFECRTKHIKSEKDENEEFLFV